MKRNIVIALLALGTAVGFGSGFAHLRHANHDHRDCPHACPHTSRTIGADARGVVAVRARRGQPSPASGPVSPPSG